MYRLHTKLWVEKALVRLEWYHNQEQCTLRFDALTFGRNL